MDYYIEAILLFVTFLALIVYFKYRSDKSKERDFRWEAMNANGISATKEEDEEQEEKIFDVENIKTVGNHSWIPVFDDCSDYPYEVPDQILLVLSCFSKSHPQLEVLSFMIESGDTCMDGIWITHRPKL